MLDLLKTDIFLCFFLRDDRNPTERTLYEDQFILTLADCTLIRKLFQPQTPRSHPDRHRNLLNLLILGHDCILKDILCNLECAGFKLNTRMEIRPRLTPIIIKRLRTTLQAQDPTGHIHYILFLFSSSHLPSFSCEKKNS